MDQPKTKHERIQKWLDEREQKKETIRRLIEEKKMEKFTVLETDKREEKKQSQ
jgi:ribosomal protein S16